MARTLPPGTLPRPPIALARHALLGALMLLGASPILAKPKTPAPPPPPDPTLYRTGIWIEARHDGSSPAQLRTWAARQVAAFDSLLVAAGTGRRARLDSFAVVPAGSLPLAGGDPQLHPDLRASTLDLMWGVPARAPLPAVDSALLRNWLLARGCSEPWTYQVAWDQFRARRQGDSLAKLPMFALDERHLVRRGAHPLISGGRLDPACARILSRSPAARGLKVYDANRIDSSLRAALPRQATIRVVDFLGRPAPAARIELWRAAPSADRGYSKRFAGEPQVFQADSAGRISFDPAERLFSLDSFVHRPTGTNAVALVRVEFARLVSWKWLEVPDLLVDTTGDVIFQLPGGSSAAWREAADAWPRQPMVAAEWDTSGALVLGLSVPVANTFVLRILGPRGKEIFRSQPVQLASAPHERRIPLRLAPGSYDVRIDSPDRRMQTRFVVPASTAPVAGAPAGDSTAARSRK